MYSNDCGLMYESVIQSLIRNDGMAIRRAVMTSRIDQ
jgi:hypothetical protein